MVLDLPEWAPLWATLKAVVEATLPEVTVDFIPCDVTSPTSSGVVPEGTHLLLMVNVLVCRSAGLLNVGGVSMIRSESFL